jgi:hypothetical protein
MHLQLREGGADIGILALALVENGVNSYLVLPVEATLKGIGIILKENIRRTRKRCQREQGNQ